MGLFFTFVMYMLVAFIVNSVLLKLFEKRKIKGKFAENFALIASLTWALWGEIAVIFVALYIGYRILRMLEVQSEKEQKQH